MIRPFQVLWLMALAALAHPSIVDAAPAAKADTTRFVVEHKVLRSKKGVSIDVDAGRLMVSERRADPKSRRIAIGFLRLRSKATSPRAPLFFLNGGPGSRAVTESPGALDFWAPLLEVSDVVLIDQRGTADEALQYEWEESPPLGFFVSVESANRHVAAMQQKALEAFESRGVDLAGYTTVESAADLDELRAALGLDRVSLLGFSYGTHLTCAYLRSFGSRVENAVLLGVEGPDQTQKLPWTMDTQLRKLSLMAARDSVIGRQVPDLVALYDRVVARLARQSMVVPVPSPDGKDTLRVPVGPFGLRFIMRVDVGDATDLPVFPRLLWSIDHGDPSVLAWFVRKRAGAALGVHGMGESMDAASGVSKGRLAMIEEQSRTSRFADVVNFPFLSGGPAWPVPDLGDDFRAPLVSPARALVISGGLDFNTPPSQGDELCWGMPNATHIVVANAGHEQTFFGNDNAMPVIQDFLRGKDVRDRKITYPELRFVPLEGRDPRHPSVSR